MSLEISDREKNLLVSILTSAISETREEIHRTDNFEYKEKLKTQKHLMESLLNRVSVGSGVEARVV